MHRKYQLIGRFPAGLQSYPNFVMAEGSLPCSKEVASGPFSARNKDYTFPLYLLKFCISTETSTPITSMKTFSLRFSRYN